MCCNPRSGLSFILIPQKLFKKMGGSFEVDAFAQRPVSSSCYRSGFRYTRLSTSLAGGVDYKCHFFYAFSTLFSGV